MVVFWLLPWVLFYFILFFCFGGDCGLIFMGCDGLMLVGYSSECGLIFMDCDEMMLVGYNGRCGLILLVRLILGFGYCG